VKKRLLQICIQGNVGSVGSMAEELGKCVLSHGWDSYIAMGRDLRPSRSKIIVIGSKLDILINVFLQRVFGDIRLGSKKSTLRLIKHIKEINPDLIHLHHLHGYFINFHILFQYLSQANIPVIWTMHDCWAFTGHCTHFSHVNCEKWKIECNNCPQLKKYPSTLFFDNSKSNYYNKLNLIYSVNDLVIVSVSNWLHRNVEQSFLNKLESTVILNGIDLDVFKPTLFSTRVIRQKYNLEERFLIMGAATRWTEQKGIFDFIALSKVLDPNCVIVLIGLDKSQIKRLPGNIIGLEVTENISDLVNLYNESDLFLNLSVEETFGLTTIEALACGTPVIVYDSTATSEILTTEAVGEVVESQNINELLKAINKIKSKGKNFYSEKCRNLVMNNYSKNLSNESYFQLYDSKLSV
jgi:glycosyltransferase involved in cell wall biosynthesis